MARNEASIIAAGRVPQENLDLEPNSLAQTENFVILRLML